MNNRSKLIQCIGLILFSFILCEILVRVFSKSTTPPPEMFKKSSLQYERTLFARNVFPLEEQSFIGDNKYKNRIFVNKLGYRGRYFSINKDPKTIRIIFYGGSSVFDIYAQEEKDWPHLVESILHSKGYENIEIINAGIPYSNSFESMGRLFSEGYLFHPDYVVLSDQWNDFKYFKDDRPILRQFTYNGIAFNPFTSYFNPVDKFLCENSYLYNKLRNKYFLYKYNLTLEGEEGKGEYIDKLNDSNISQYKLNVEMFIDLAKNIHAVPVLMTEPRLINEINTPEQNNRINYKLVKLTHNAVYQAYKETDNILHNVSLEKNVKLIDIGKELAGIDNLYEDQVHTTPLGSQIIADKVATAFTHLLGK